MKDRGSGESLTQTLSVPTVAMRAAGGNFSGLPAFSIRPQYFRRAEPAVFSITQISRRGLESRGPFSRMAQIPLPNLPGKCPGIFEAKGSQAHQQGNQYSARSTTRFSQRKILHSCVRPLFRCQGGRSRSAPALLQGVCCLFWPVT